MDQLEQKLEDFFSNTLPQLPPKNRYNVAKILPMLTLIGAALGVVLAIPIILTSIGGSLFSGSIGASLSMLVNVAAYLLSTYLFVTAYNKVKAYQKSGWDNIFKAEIILLAGALLGFIIGGLKGFSSVFYSALFCFVWIYLLYQVRDYFTGKVSIKDEVL